MSLFDDFKEFQITVTPVTITSAPPDWEPNPVDQAPQKAILFNTSAASRYFNQTWSEAVTSVLITKDITNITNKGEIKVGTTTYTIDSVEDPGSNNLSGFDNVYVSGLVVQK